MRLRARHVMIGLAVLAGPTHAQTAAETCAKMQAEDRLGPITVAQCRCNYSVAEQVLDPDLRALLFDAWHNGNNNLAKMEQLRPKPRVRRQLRSMAEAVAKHCS